MLRRAAVLAKAREGAAVESQARPCSGFKERWGIMTPALLEALAAPCCVPMECIQGLLTEAQPQLEAEAGGLPPLHALSVKVEVLTQRLMRK